MSVSLNLTASASVLLSQRAADRTGSTAVLTPSYQYSATLFVGFAAISSTYQYRQILSFIPTVSVTGENAWNNLAMQALAASFNAATVTWNTQPSGYGNRYLSTSLLNGRTANFYNLSAADRWHMLHYGFKLTGDNSVVYTSRGAYPPKIAVVLSDSNVGLTPLCSPTSGYVPKGKANTLSWSFANLYQSYTLPTQTSATVSWRYGSSGTVHTINAGTAQSVTIPANTWTQDEVQWRVSVTASSGVTNTSAWMRLSTAEATSVATVVSPINEIVNGDEPIILQWTHSISTGTAQTAADIQTSTDGATWTALASVTGAETQYTVPAGTLSAGTLYWRVRTYNTDDTAGPWSDAAQLLVVASPAAPVVSVDVSPMSVISWTSMEQEAYQVTVDGYDSGEMWGQATSWTVPEYLPDGSYTAAVRVKNGYGLWGPWGAWAFTVVNVPGDAITLTSEDGQDVSLEWETSGTYLSYIIYRDGERIAETPGTEWADGYASAGSHEYMIRGMLAGGNYTDSNVVTAECIISSMLLRDMETGALMSIPTVLAGDVQTGVSRTRQIVLQHYEGVPLPAAEIGEARTRTVTFRPTFPRVYFAMGDQLDGMIGRIVHLRTPYGDAMYGIVTALPATKTPHLRTFDVTVEEIAYVQD